jgi:hypothetical protein
MEIKEVEELRIGLEIEFQDIINEFEKKTGLVIDRIDLEHTQNVGEKPKTRIIQIKVAL